VRQRWPWRKKDVPVSKPTESAQGDPYLAIQDPAASSASAEPSREAPAAPKPAAPRESSGAAVGPKAWGKPEIVAASLLQVNDRFFTVDDIVKLAGPRLAELPRHLPAALLRPRVEEIITTTMREQVSQTLVLERVESLISEEVNRRIESQVEQQRKTMVAEAGSEKALEAKLAEKGTTVEQALDYFRRSLKVRTFLQNKFESATVVSRRMLWEYYRSHEKEFTRPKKVQMQIIAEPIEAFGPEGSGALTPAELTAARQQAGQTIKKAAEALKGGKDFGEVAISFSRGIKASSGGLWPLMPAGSFIHTEVEKAAFSLGEGQVSDIIETEAGFFIVKAKRVVAEELVSFEDAQAGIEQRLRADRYEQLVGEYLEELYSSATIKRCDELLNFAVERAIARHLYN
jgi:parvulin-like peptidyl-prolyl isomerase